MNVVILNQLTLVEQWAYLRSDKILRKGERRIVSADLPLQLVAGRIVGILGLFWATSAYIYSVMWLARTFAHQVLFWLLHIVQKNKQDKLSKHYLQQSASTDHSAKCCWNQNKKRLEPVWVHRWPPCAALVTMHFRNCSRSGASLRSGAPQVHYSKFRTM